MVEVHRCDECNKESLAMFAIIRETVGSVLPKREGELCSYRCVEVFANRMRRTVGMGRVSQEGVMTLVTYHNSEIGKLGCWEVYKEKETLCVKPEVWRQRLNGD